MQTTGNQRVRAACVSALVAVILLNVLGLCSAAVPPPPPQTHACCPVTPQGVPRPEPCGKLGCFMSAPLIQPKLQSVQRPAWNASPEAEATQVFVLLTTQSTDACVRTLDRFIEFRQLLI